MPRRSFLSTLALLQCVSLFAQEGSVGRDGFALHYGSEGSGTPIVFLSGGPGLEVDYFVPAAKLFPAGYRRIYLEQRGTGRSRPAKLTLENMTLRLAVEDLEALRRHLKVERLLLAGHSWGGMLAMAYGASYPDRVDRLILIGSGGPDNEFRARFGDNIAARLHAEDMDARQKWIAAGKEGADIDKVRMGALKAIVPAYFFDRAKGLGVAAAFPDRALRADASELLNQDLGKHYDLRSTLTKLTRPVLILQGHQDPMGDKTAEEIKALLPSATLRYFNKCGHFPWIERPDEMQAAIADFLKRGGAVD